MYLKPVLPELAQHAETFLNTGELTWQSIATPLLNQRLNAFIPLMTRLDPEQVEQLLRHKEC